MLRVVFEFSLFNISHFITLDSAKTFFTITCTNDPICKCKWPFEKGIKPLDLSLNPKFTKNPFASLVSIIPYNIIEFEITLIDNDLFTISGSILN